MSFKLFMITKISDWSTLWSVWRYKLAREKPLTLLSSNFALSHLSQVSRFPAWKTYSLARKPISIILRGYPKLKYSGLWCLVDFSAYWWLTVMWVLNKYLKQIFFLNFCYLVSTKCPTDKLHWAIINSKLVNIFKSTLSHLEVIEFVFFMYFKSMISFCQLTAIEVK